MNRLLYQYLLLFLCLQGCSMFTEQSKAKGGSETTNGITAQVKNPEGKPMVNARVSIRPVDFVDTTVLAKVLSTHFETYTDAQGWFSIPEMQSGVYFLEINDGKELALLKKIDLSGDSSPELGQLQTLPYIRVKGTIDTSGLSASALVIKILGTTKSLVAAPSGDFQFDSIPYGDVCLQVTMVVNNMETQIVQSVLVSPGNIVTIQPKLPSPWQQTNLTGNSDGNAALIDGQFALSGYAPGIDSMDDNAFFLYQEHAGDFLLESFISRLDSSTGNAFAFLMIRNSLEPDAAFAATATNKDGIFFLWREKSGGRVERTEAFLPDSLPAEIKIERIQDSLLGYYSMNKGKTWTRIAAKQIQMFDTVFSGMGIVSGSESNLTNALFEDPVFEVVQ